MNFPPQEKAHLTSDTKAVARELLRMKCVQFNLQSPYSWVSGIQSPIYCDNRKINSFVDGRRVVLNAFSRLISEKFPDVQLIAGVATGGIPMGVMAAYQLEKPFVYVRQEPKKHGLKQQVEGSFSEGDKAVLIEDHVSTGGSSVKAIKGMQESKIKVQCIISIMTYGFLESVEKFNACAVAHYSLTDLDTVLDVAVEMNILKPSEREAILRFRAAPQDWNP